MSDRLRQVLLYVYLPIYMKNLYVATESVNFFQAASPACTELEVIVLDWMGNFFFIQYSYNFIMQ